MSGPLLTFTPLAESALLVRLGDAISPEAVERVTGMTRTLDGALLDGVLEIVPAYTTILIEFDAERIDGAQVEAWVSAAAERTGDSAAADPRIVIIPVLYGGQHGPDLAGMAEMVGLGADEVAARHAGGDYTVACMGFSPGWAYLMGLPAELTVPRRSEPRTRIPPGSVAVGGAQTGVYPLESPGGWHLIGRTPLTMFDPGRDEPFLLKQGDHVRFAPIDDTRYDALRAEQNRS